jgi:ATP-binding cassette subfamily C protein
MKIQSDRNLDLLEFLYILYKLSSKNSFVIILLNLVSSLTESVGFAMLLPFLDLSGMKLSNKLPYNISLELIVIIFSITLCIFAILSYYRLTIVNRAEWAMTNSEQKKLFESIAKAKWDEVLTHRKSDLIEILLKEIRQVGFAYVQSSSMISASLNFLFLTSIACFISLPATIFSLTLGLFIIILTKPLNRLVLKAGKEAFPANQNLFAICDSHLESIPLIKIFNSTDIHIQNFSLACQKLANITQKFISARAKTALFYRVTVALSLGICAYLSIKYNLLSMPEFIVLSALFSRIVPQLLVLHHSYQTILNCIPSYSVVMNATELFNNVEDAQSSSSSDSAPHNFNLSSRIEFKDVSYCYPRSNRNALENITINLITKGIVSISGPSGSGKSTFVRLLSGLLSPTNGSINIGANTIESSNLTYWRENIGYVPQETILPYSSIRDSLLLAKPQATELDLWEVIEKVSLKGVIDNLPLKLDTLLGDKGCLLSGGERQRLAIARALLRKPLILILDEATNSLDKATENIIFSLLEEYRRDSLIIIISHQELSHLKVDQKLFFNEGSLTS